MTDRTGAVRHGIPAPARPVPEAVRDHIGLRVDGCAPGIGARRVDHESQATPLRFRAQRRQRLGTRNRPIEHAEARLDERLHASASGVDHSLHDLRGRMVPWVERRGPFGRPARFVEEMRKIPWRRVGWDAQRAVPTDDAQRAAAMVEARMKACTFKPGPVCRPRIDIDDGGETEGEVGARNLRAIRRQQFRMLLDRRFVESHGISDMYVRVYQAGNQIPAVRVDSPRAGRRTEVGAHGHDPAVADDDIRIAEWAVPLR